MHKYDVIFHQSDRRASAHHGGAELRMDNIQDDINVCVCRNGDVVAVLNSVVCERPQTDWSDWGIVEYRHVTNPRNLNSIMYRAVTLAE